MVKQVVNVGANANDGTGDDLRTAMQKINTNFTELFGTTAEANDLVEDGTPQLGGNLDIQNYIITTNTTNGAISIQPNGSGAVLLKNIRITDNVISSDDSTNITINDSLIVTGSISTPTLYTNMIQNEDSSIVKINDGLQVVGVMKSTSVITNSLSSDDSSAIEIAEDLLVSGTVSTESVRTNSLYSEAIQIVDNNISARRSNDDLVLSPSGTGSVNLKGAKITNLGTPTANGDAATKQYVDGVVLDGLTSTSITLVGDDSTGTAISLGESFKIAGTSNITTAVSGDTLTITGPNLSSYLTNSTMTVVGDDSAGVTLNTGETIKVAGGTGITTAVSGDTLTITGPSLTGYAQKTDTAITLVGDDSTGTAVTIGETIKIAGSTGITTAVSGDTLTITGPNLSSYLTNSTMTVVGDDSAGVTLNSGETLKIAGGTGITTAVSGDTLTITGLSQSTMTFVGDDSTGVTVNSGETIKIAGSGGVTTSVSGDTLTIDATLTGGALANLSVTDQTISGTTTNGDIDITPNGTGDINLTVGGQVKITNGINDYNAVFSLANTQARYDYGLSSFTYELFDLSLDNQNRVYANSLAGHIVLSGTDRDNNSGQLGWRGTQVDLITDLDGNELIEKSIVVADPSSKGSNRNNNSGGEIRTYSAGPIALSAQNSFRNTNTSAAALSEATGINSFTVFDHNFDSSVHGAVTVQEFSGVNTGVNLASGSGTTNITNLVGYRAVGNYFTNGTGNVTNYYAFYAHDTSEATNNYGIYVENDSYENYLGGLVVKNSTIAANRSNESLYLSTSGTGKVIVNDSLQVINTLTANTIITNDISSADSSAVQINDSVNISGTLSVDTIDTNTISSADSSAIQINNSVNISGTLNSATIVNNTISTNEIASADSSAIQINDGVNISGTLNAKTIVTNDLISQDSSVINVLDGLNVSGALTTTSINSSSTVSAEHLTLTGLLTLGNKTILQLSVLTPSTGTVAYCTDEPGGAQTVFYDGTNWRRTSDLAVMGSGGSSTLSTVTLKVNNIESDDSSVIQINDAIELDGQLNLNGNKIINVQDPTTNQDAATKNYVDNQIISAGAGTVVSITAGTGLTGGTISTTGTLALDFSTVVARVVGDDSTGTDLRVGETFKIAGGTGISTAISGDTITITNTGGVGGGNGFTVVGDDSTGTLISDGETIKIAGTSGITTSMSGDVLTISGPDLSSYLTSVPKTIDINVISSSDSSAIQVNDSLNVSGTITVGTLVTSNISAPSSTTGTYTISSPTTITLSPSSEVLNTAPFTLYSRTVAQLAALTASVGAMVYCTNETGGAVPVFFDGTNWRKVTDRAIAS